MKKNLEKVIELRNLVKTYGKHTVVDDINLNIRRGEFVTFLGPSGCGKTTTLRMIAGFEVPTSGTITLEGQDVTYMPPHLRNVNTVFQKYALFPHLDVYNNIAFGLKLKKIPVEGNDKKKRKYKKDEIKEIVEKYLKLVGLDDYGHRDVDSLSGGQQQRVAIARALANQPRVLLLDEPLGALDLKMRKEMQQELRRMHKELGITFIFVTHDQEEALTMSDTIVVINDGVVQQVGTPRTIYDKPKNAFVADFIGQSNIMNGVMLADLKVKFLEQTFDCLARGFANNEPVDIVIRPENIIVHEAASKKAQLKGVVLSSSFKGTFWEKTIQVGDYEFTVNSVENYANGTNVGLEIKPPSIHIMEKDCVVNEIKTTMTSDTTVNIGGVDFDVIPDGNFAKGDLVTAFIEFKHIEFTDDQEDGRVGANVTSLIYKGTRYEVKVWTDNDIPLIAESEFELDIDDRVGILIKPEHIRLEKREEVES